MPIARQLSKALFIVTASAALAVASGITSLSGTQVWGAERPILVNEIEDASRIVCRNRYGMTVFTANDAYNVRIDPSGTIYSFRKGWLSDRTYTYVKAIDVSCAIMPNRW